MKHSGLCIDGTLAGQMYAAYGNAFQMPEIPPLPVALSDPTEDDSITVRVFTYVHDRVRLMNDHWFCIWRLQDDTSAEALQKLSEGYTQNCARLKNLDRVTHENVEMATYAFVRQYVGGEGFLKGVPASNREDIIKHRMNQFRKLVRTALEAVWP